MHLKGIRRLFICFIENNYTYKWNLHIYLFSFFFICAYLVSFQSDDIIILCHSQSTKRGYSELFCIV